jgi:plasmid stability protein
MPKMIQIRNVPDDLHQRLKARAAAAGMTLSDYMLAQAEEAADTISLKEWVDRIATRESVELPESAEEPIRKERDAGH